MPNTPRRRRQYFVDPKVQGTLALRVVLYWVVCVFTVTVFLLCWRIISNPNRLFSTYLNELWFYYGPAIAASFAMLPLILLDVIRFSNRFVGPLVRLRRSMRSLARGEHVEPISFRKNDFWLEFAQEFNAVLARVQRESQPSVASPPPCAAASSTTTPPQHEVEAPCEEPIGTSPK